MTESLQKLDWQELTQVLANLNQTEEGRERSLALAPTLTKDEVEARWQKVEPLKILSLQGYKAPIGELPILPPYLKAASIGQILDGIGLRTVSTTLHATRKVYGFCNGFQKQAPYLAHIKSQILPLDNLLLAIDRAIGPDGDLLDSASDELLRIRKSKVSQRKRIEETIVKLMHSDDGLRQYLQDDFFTVRDERYVLPIRVDGRGRVKGSIIDTSVSGQTLYLEPPEVSTLNTALRELDIEEKLEIARIFRMLSEAVQKDVEVLAGNYHALIQLDELTSQALLAAQLEGNPVTLSDTPSINLKHARHPLLHAKGAVPNDISLNPEQHLLIVSGPNAGGKTVVLKTVGLIIAMAKSGLLPSTASDSELYLFDNIFIEMGDSQSLSSNLSTFSGHLVGLKPILERANKNDLVLLDELCVGTDPHTGAAIGTAILEDLAAKEVKGIITTHYDALKSLAVTDGRFRNGSMEFSLGNLKPTYKLILDIPGQSFGVEVAEQIGLPKGILQRAKELRSGTMSNLDLAVSEMLKAKEEARVAKSQMERERLTAESEKIRWQQEVTMLKESREKVSETLTKRYESKLQDLRREFEEATTEFKEATREARKSDSILKDAFQLSEQKQNAEQKLKTAEHTLRELNQSYKTPEQLPGVPADRTTLKVGNPVYVLPLKKVGKVVRIPVSSDEAVEVEVGILKLRVAIQDLRALSPGEAPKK